MELLQLAKGEQVRSGGYSFAHESWLCFMLEWKIVIDKLRPVNYIL
jgi:hypothetical protein